MFGPWNLANYQLAALIDSSNRMLAAYAGAPMPEQIPRPMPKTRKGSSFDPAAVAYLQAIRDRHAREAGA
ncbi:MAG: hypothetical protein ACXVXP_02990 [Mycobacteriaceae bacterium]